MARAKEEYEKQLKRSNDKQLKLEHELCCRVSQRGREWGREERNGSPSVAASPVDWAS